MWSTAPACGRARLDGFAASAFRLHAAEHFYVVTEPIAALGADIPVLRDPDHANYFKDDAGKLLIGWFEPVARALGPSRAFPKISPSTNCRSTLEHIEPQLEKAMRRVPILAEYGHPGDVQRAGKLHAGRPLPTWRSSRARQLLRRGRLQLDRHPVGGRRGPRARGVDRPWPPADGPGRRRRASRRAVPGQTPLYLRDRTVETLGLLYAMHWPNYGQYQTARNARRTPLHDRLVVALAPAWARPAGWERPNW